MKISDIGEKKLIAEYIKPLFNPHNLPELPGDDCALLNTTGSWICVSTDRVPANLISFKLGIINYKQLGYYLAVLNISDIAAAGGIPLGLLLNFGLPDSFELNNLLDLFLGVHEASNIYNCPVVGGDLSDSHEMTLVATSIGSVQREKALFRSRAMPGDLVFCSDDIGVTSTAFAHFLRNDSEQIDLSGDEYKFLTKNFCSPRACVDLGIALGDSKACTSAMDVTDGFCQSLHEISIASSVRINIEATHLPVAKVSQRLSKEYNIPIIDLIMGPGADFQLVGTVNPDADGFRKISDLVRIVGQVTEGSGVFLLCEHKKEIELEPKGWDYFSERTR